VDGEERRSLGPNGAVYTCLSIIFECSKRAAYVTALFRYLLIIEGATEKVSQFIMNMIYKKRMF
jgi:hypothetical protein